MPKYEYMLHTWGGFYNDEHKAMHGEEPGYKWFDTKDDCEAEISRLRAIESAYGARHLAIDLAEGFNTRLRTIAKMTLMYDGKEYSFEYDFGYAYPPESAEYMFIGGGNYTCDCNRSLFLRNQGVDIPELDCGDLIQAKDFTVVTVE